MNIPATIGILAYNSERHLERALESVKDFNDIVIADGGSTDATLAIAKRFGARVIAQSNPGHPIVDFSKERNLLLAAATEPWFFYLDADEIMSRELAGVIARVAGDPVYGAYRVRYQKTDADGTSPYRTYKEYYQIRLVRTTIGAYFEWPVHEHVVLPPGIRVGQIESPWYVPLDAEDLSVRAFSRKAWGRIEKQSAAWKPAGVIEAFRAVLLTPLTLIAKSLIKMAVVRVQFGREGIPTKYEFLRILYAVFLMTSRAKRAFTYVWH